MLLPIINIILVYWIVKYKCIRYFYRLLKILIYFIHFKFLTTHNIMQLETDIKKKYCFIFDSLLYSLKLKLKGVNYVDFFWVRVSERVNIYFFKPPPVWTKAQQEAHCRFLLFFLIFFVATKNAFSMLQLKKKYFMGTDWK